MPRPGLSEEQFLAAVETLVNADKTVTVSAVRDVLGTGSYSTINAFLSKWKEQSRVDLDLPPIPDVVQRSFASCWTVAYQAAQEAVRHERQALEQAQQEMEAAKIEIEAEMVRLEHESVAQADQLESLRLELEHARQTQHQLEVDNARLDERAKKSEQQVKSLEEQLAKLSESFKLLASNSQSSKAATLKVTQDNPRT